MTIRPCALLLVLALAPALARAQKTPVPVADAPPPPEYGPAHVIGFGGVGLDLALPTGDFRHYVTVGGGFDGFFALKLVPSGALSLRLDLTVLLYGSETRRYPLVPLIDVDVTTSNTILGMNIGPQFVATSGRIRPYAMGGIGFAYFNTSSSVSGSDNSEPFANSTNFGDGTFAIRAGGGLWIQVGHGRTPVWIDLGAQYLWNGKVSYLRPGSIDLGPPVVYHPIRSETHLWMIHAGVSAPIAPKGS